MRPAAERLVLTSAGLDAFVVARARVACISRAAPGGCGFIYIGRAGDTLKIGYSRNPLWRAYDQNLQLQLLIPGCAFAHETILHRRFAAELVGGREVFRGPSVERFLGKLRARATIRVREICGDHHFVEQERRLSAVASEAA